MRKNVASYACHIEQEKSLSLSSPHTVGRGPPILKSQRFSSDVLHQSHCLHCKSTSFDSTFNQVVVYTPFPCFYIPNKQNNYTSAIEKENIFAPQSVHQMKITLMDQSKI